MGPRKMCFNGSTREPGQPALEVTDVPVPVGSERGPVRRRPEHLPIFPPADTGRWPDLPNFDGAVFAERDLLGPLDGFVLRGAPDHVEPTEEPLRLREGRVDHEPPSGFE